MYIIYVYTYLCSLKYYISVLLIFYLCIYIYKGIFKKSHAHMHTLYIQLKLYLFYAYTYVDVILEKIQYTICNCMRIVNCDFTYQMLC